MSWSLKNLFIIHQRGATPPRLQNRSLYQQKWQAKKDTRAYHGAQLNERQFKNVFEPRLPASNTRVSWEDKDRKLPPAAVLTYACLERRLDFIIFRSCFASSIWTARQMVLSGKVKVNDIKLANPSHMAKDGDIISVNPKAIRFLDKPDPSQPGIFKPVPFMQPFLFIPDYLEVNFNTCSTVYLRAPMLRPGKSEIPSPFPPEFHSLAYEFYVGLKKRKKKKGPVESRHYIPRNNL
ncbi:hypothetical protein G9A89_019116 [Geosiphon pyriformis]|nr:hypothetical protein G9A89_019116 [Geosiphon pyriformis]